MCLRGWHAWRGTQRILANLFRPNLEICHHLFPIGFDRPPEMAKQGKRAASSAPKRAAAKAKAAPAEPPAPEAPAAAAAAPEVAPMTHCMFIAYGQTSSGEDRADLNCPVVDKNVSHDLRSLFGDTFVSLWTSNKLTAGLLVADQPNDTSF